MFPDDIHKLASKIAEKAAKEDVLLADMVDALGKLTPYYALYLKANSREDDEPASFAEVIERERSRSSGGQPAVTGQTKDPMNGGGNQKVRAGRGN